MTADEVRKKLAGDTGTLGWAEIERHFARGRVVLVSSRLALLDVAQAMARDDKATLADWLKEGLVARATDDHARHWHSTQTELRAVVVAPWVVVQETE